MTTASGREVISRSSTRRSRQRTVNQLSGTKLSATKSAYKVTKRSGDKSEWKVKITMSAVDGDLDTVEDLSWSNRTATSTAYRMQAKYEVKGWHRNSSTVTIVTTTGTSYNFYPHDDEIRRLYL